VKISLLSHPDQLYESTQPPSQWVLEALLPEVKYLMCKANFLLVSSVEDYEIQELYHNKKAEGPFGMYKFSTIFQILPSIVKVVKYRNLRWTKHVAVI
jgi:hypothetical protein